MSFIGTPMFWVIVSAMIIILLLMAVMIFVLLMRAKNARHIVETYNERADYYTKKAEKYGVVAQKSAADVEKNNEDADQYRNTAREKKNLAKRYDKLAKGNKILAGVASIVSVFISIMLIISFNLLKKKRSIDESYYNVFLLNQNSGDTTSFEVFKKYEREYKSEQDWAREALHMGWYDDTFKDDNKYITKEHMKHYHENVRNILMEIPHNTDIRNVPNDLDEFNHLLDIFKHAVSESIGVWDPEELWNAFEAGKEIAKIYNTSEIVFQTFVLAEGAHGNAYERSRNDPNTLKYLAGATEKMEEFIKFITKDPGDGTSVSLSSMSFRLGKMDYREGSREKNENNPEARHFILKAYEEFHYSIENIAMDDEKYLTDLYYCSLACLRMMSYVNDSELRKELCELELERWAEFKEYIGDCFNSMKVENNNNLQEIIDSLNKYRNE